VSAVNLRFLNLQKKKTEVKPKRDHSSGHEPGQMELSYASAIYKLM
jgi:hypothetical protein